MANIESVKLPNGSEYNIKDAISGYALQSEMSVTDGTGADADKTTIQLKSGTSATVLKTHQSISGKADKVTGGTNGNLASLDGNGNLTDAGVALNVSSPTNGQVMSYNGTSSKWENATMDLSSKVDKTDISSILATGATNTTGATITAGTYFYLNGALVKAKADIAVNASFTLNTNYEAVTVGGEFEQLNASVSVLGNGVMTWGQMFNALYALVDRTKVTAKAVLKFTRNASGDAGLYNLYSESVVSLAFTNTQSLATKAIVSQILLHSTSSYYKDFDTSTSATTDYSNTVTSNTEKITLYY